MKKILNRILRTKDIQIYFSTNKNFPELGILTKIKTKKRLKQLMQSMQFIYDVKSVTIKHGELKAFIYRANIDL